jgi:hypothetical protein
MVIFNSYVKLPEGTPKWMVFIPENPSINLVGGLEPWLGK